MSRRRPARRRHCTPASSDLDLELPKTVCESASGVVDHLVEATMGMEQVLKVRGGFVSRDSVAAASAQEAGG